MNNIKISICTNVVTEIWNLLDLNFGQELTDCLWYEIYDDTLSEDLTNPNITNEINNCVKLKTKT